MSWIITDVLLLLAMPLGVTLLLVGTYYYLVHQYMDNLLRIFAETPIFVIPRGQRPDAAEDLRLATPDGLTLAAAYLRTSAARRKGVILFGLEFGANRWS